MSKWFTRFYDRVMEPLENKGFREIRKKLIEHAQGQVLEIGSGTGLNFPHYKNVQKVWAIEPQPLMREQSISRVKSASVPIEVLGASAEELPFADHTFDSVVGTLVFCTIPNTQKALEEIRRVSKPNARVLLFEHVRHPNLFLGRLQDSLTPMWKSICDGCHLNRDTRDQLKRSGFIINRFESHYKNIFVVIEALNKK